MSESVETLVKQILAELSDSGSASQGSTSRPVSSDEATAADYPISKKHPDWIKVGQDKKFEDITLENILSGYVTAEDKEGNGKNVKYRLVKDTERTYHTCYRTKQSQ